jgi:hypothetical protein
MKEELEKELPPALRDLKARGDGMQKPPGYFDSLEDKVLQRLDAAGARRPQAPEVGWRVWVRPQRLAAMAASVAVVVGAFWWLQTPMQPEQAAVATMEEPISSEMAALYIEENILDFEPELLASNDEVAPTTTESVEPAKPKSNTKKATPKPKDDLDEVLDELTEEELESLL